MLQPRNRTFPVAEVPPYWMNGSPFATHLANGLHLIFPRGERFFIRSVRQFADVVRKNPVLEAEVRAFAGQEAMHAREHERYFEVLAEQGFDPKPFMAIYAFAMERVLEPVFPAKMKLAVTVALEHFTAVFAERALSDDALLAEAHPVMRDLLKWHAAEEIEHKSVAFDVLKAVDPSYALRMSGLAVATASLFGFWWLGAWMLMRQDPHARREGSVVLGVLRFVSGGEPGTGASGKGASMLPAFLDYLRPDFHPSDRDNGRLAARYFAAS